MSVWRTLLLSVAVLGTVALYFVLRPAPAPAPAAETVAVPAAAQPASTVSSAPASAAPASAALPEYALNVGASSPAAPLMARQGDVIKLTVLSPDAGEVMLHGYPTALEVQPGTPASVEIKLGRSGRFAVHFHNDQTGAHKALGELVVRKH
jgi:hypothetical protein